MPRHRVVVIGAGFGGLAAARALADQPVDVVLIDANNFSVFSPLLYQVATAGLSGDDIAYTLRGLFRRQRNIEVRMARVTAVDLEARRVEVSAGEPVDYDTLIVAAGAVSSSFGVPGVDEHALQLKSIDDAIAIRNHVLQQYEDAANEPDRFHDGDLDVVVCGGGPTGVELAGALVELFSKVLVKDFPGFAVDRARVVLVEAADRLLGTFDPKSSRRALRTLTRRGVDVRLGTGVERIRPSTVALADGTEITAGTVIWAAGVRASPFAADARLRARSRRTDRRRRRPLRARPSGGVRDRRHRRQSREHPLPQVALPAVQGGKHVAAQIGRRLAGRPTEPFVYRDLGTMATIGRHDAIAEFPIGIRLAGLLGWFAWLGLHIIRLLGVRNRLAVLVNWAWNYVTYDRSSRLLKEQPLDDSASTAAIADGRG